MLHRIHFREEQTFNNFQLYCFFINLEYISANNLPIFLILAKLRPEYKFLHNAYLKRIRESTNPSKFFISKERL